MTNGLKTVLTENDIRCIARNFGELRTQRWMSEFARAVERAVLAAGKKVAPAIINDAAVGKAIEQACNVIREVGKNEYNKDELDVICDQIYLVFGRALQSQPSQDAAGNHEGK